MTELYTNMRYLQFDTLNRLGLGQFDAWAASFGETQTAIELAPEGTGYRAKTRFAKFFNLPELISLFKESADIQTPDMLKLPVPEAEYENVVLKPSEFQKDMVKSLADRAEAVRDRRVDASVDNMLKITNDGRKLALDQRLMNPMLPDDENSKSAVCVEKAFEIWNETKVEKSTQLIFCDLSTPKGDGTFNVYEDIRDKLVAKGVPAEEIAFIHDANTETRKAELFAKVRSGQVRFLLGSTAKMGAGTNVQDKLIALHHLDVPWRPSDIEQQEGRILRQGNTNPKVKIFRYVTEGTFDSYSWQLIENKQKFIGQIMTSKSPVRSCEDVDEAALSYAEVKALATGNPYIKQKMDLDIQVSKLKLMKANHTSQKYRLEDNITQHYPQQIAILSERIAGFKADIAQYEAHKPADKEAFLMTVGGKEYTDRKEAGTALIAMCKEIRGINANADVGEYLGFKMNVTFDSFNNKFVLNMKGAMSHPLEVGADPSGNITRINNSLEAMPGQLEEAQTKLANVEHQLETAKIEVTKEFPQEAELAEKLDKLAALNALLNMDERGDEGAQLDENAAENVGDVGENVGKNVGERVFSETDTKETLAQSEPIYTIYQLKDNPELDDRRFESTASLMRMGILKDNYAEVKPEHYKIMYSGKLSEMEGESQSAKLESIFEKFNLNRPEDFKGHSLSVSDIVVLKQEGKTTAHFVDSFGFTGLPEFAKELENAVDSELAVKVGDFYVSIHESDEGLDYSIFDADYHLIDGGVTDDPNISIHEALKQVIEDMGEGGTTLLPVNYEQLSEETDAVAQADMEAGVKALQEADSLAAEVDAFIYDFNPHEYNNQMEDRHAQIDTISKDLQNGEAGYITSYLQEIVSQGAGTTDEQVKAQELIAKIQEYKPLAKVEEIEEQNYNQIDNVLNNGFEQKKEEKEREARGEKGDKRPSLKQRLEEKKELVAREPERPAPDKDISKKKAEELS
jgi:ribosomal protein S17E